MEQDYEVVVIGGGPGGYVAAIRCAQLGLKTACIDAWRNDKDQPALGGTCLNVGCIPSKALLHSSELYYQARTAFGAHGIKTGGLGIDLAVMQARKDKVVEQLTGGIEGLFKANGVSWLQGHGRLLDGTRVEFTPHEGEARTLTPGHVILASGSRPLEIALAPLDEEYIVDSTGALGFTEVPRRLGIIGAGIIGLELGSVWNRLGSEVVLLEAQEQFLPMVDGELSRHALKILGQQGLDIRLGARVLGSEVTDGEVRVSYQQEGEERSLAVDRLVVAVGRRANTEDLVAEAAGLVLDERGGVVVDEYCATNIPNIYAVGDLVRGPMLAHKASEEGMAVAESIASGRPHGLRLDTVPSVIYTEPELAWVGATEQQLKSLGTPYRAGSFPLAANGRALAMQVKHGLAKVLAHAETDEILGVHILGPGASELIAEAVLAMEYAASSEDLARTIHAHPTLSEALHEAALAVDGRAIHRVNRR
ncbi:MAG TPA: dihydrolipoyl dehydrogenase [Gammaproteobacteria bacterium]|nr:dihydrolipoyl dehydrogenase [Gammaproteobacteria bacterium]